MATILKFSEAAALAFHAMARIATAQETILSARTLAADFRASEAHMSKVCRRLVQGGLLRPYRGAAGGFSLTKSPGQIRLIDIYTVIEGEVVLHPCLFQSHPCNEKNPKKCVFGTMIMGFEKDVLRYLRTTSLATIAASCTSQGEAREATRR